jgi:hypothetical protein
MGFSTKKTDLFQGSVFLNENEIILVIAFA